MASRHVRFGIVDYASQSEDSEEDNDLSNITPSLTGIMYQTVSVDTLIDEISRYNITVNNADLYNLYVRKRKKTYASKAVQANLVKSGNLPSWIIEGQVMADSLYRDLNSIISMLYQYPLENLSQETAQGHFSPNIIRPPSGSTHTILRVPRVRSHCPTETDFQHLIVNSKLFKMKLRALKDTAAKLETLIPFLDPNLNVEPETTDEKASKSMKNKYQQTDFERTVEDITQGIKSEKCSSLASSLENCSNLKSDAKASGVDGKTSKRHSYMGCNLQKSEFRKGTFKSAGGTRVSRSCESIYPSLYNIPSHKLQKNMEKVVERNVGNTGKIPSRSKEGKITKESTLSQNKEGACGNSNKNFIKKNILALKSRSDAATSNKSASAANHGNKKLPDQKKENKKSSKFS